MFTGLVSAVARVRETRGSAVGQRLTLERPSDWKDIRDGESIAVSGVCLTVVPAAFRPDGPGLGASGGAPCAALSFDVSPETLRRSTLGRLRPGDRVNLERALAAGDRLGGHLVAGHVDATTQTLGVERTGDFWTFRFALGDDWARYLVEKGSIALDGVSLTVASLGPGCFEVAVVPHTFAVTTLADRLPGEPVNVEVDLIGKYVERLVRPYAPGGPGTDERLERLLRG